MLDKQELQEQINNKLSFFFSFMKNRNAFELFGKKSSAEDLFCLLFSVLFDSPISRLTGDDSQAPVLYLASRSKHTAFLVTFEENESSIQRFINALLRESPDLQYARLIVLIPGSVEPTILSGLNFKRPFYFSAKRDIWNSTHLFAKLSSVSEEQKTALSNYLTNTMLNTAAAGKSLYLPVCSTLPSKNFIGRKHELKGLRRLIKEGCKPIVISGCSGIGKTELAVQFAREYYKGTIFFVQFDNTFYRTVALSMSKGIVSFPERSGDVYSEAEQYHTVLSILAQCSSEDIIIIDNVESTDHTLDYLMSEPAFHALLELNAHLILITRSVTSHTSLIVGTLPEPDLLKLMRLYYNNNVYTDDHLLPLICEVDHHTLITELLARTLASSWDAWTPDSLLSALQDGHLEQLDLPAITTNYDHCRECKTLYGHLQTLFVPSIMTQDTQALLQCIELMPKGSVNDASFYDCLPGDLHNSLRGLINSHWLKQQDGTLSVPFVERQFIWNSTTCSEQQISLFMDNLWNTLDINPGNAEGIQQMETSFSAAAEKLPDATGEFAIRAGMLANILGHTQQAIHYLERAIAIRESSETQDYLGIATACIEASDLYMQIGDVPHFLELRLKALASMEHELPSDHLDLARTYQIIGQCYYDTGKLHQSLLYFSKAISIYSNIVPSDDLALSSCSSMVLNTCYAIERNCKDSGEYAKVLENYLYMLQTQKEHPQKEYIDTAELCNHIAKCFHHLGKREDSMAYQLQALEIQKQRLSHNSLEMMQAFSDVGNRYLRYRNDSSALPYFLDAINIGEYILPKDSAILSELYRKVRSIYGKLGDAKNARKYRRKAK